MTPAELERLAILSEECGEVIQVIGKIIRHGYDSWHPSDPDKKTNREHLETELADVGLIINHMHDTEDINLLKFTELTKIKKGKINKYLHHNKIK